MNRYSVFEHGPDGHCKIVTSDASKEFALKECAELNQALIDENGGHNDTGWFYTTDANDKEE